MKSPSQRSTYGLVGVVFEVAGDFVVAVSLQVLIMKNLEYIVEFITG
jgi:hypothetical protein